VKDNLEILQTGTNSTRRNVENFSSSNGSNFYSQQTNELIKPNNGSFKNQMSEAFKLRKEGESRNLLQLHGKDSFDPFNSVDDHGGQGKNFEIV
jgi:hypothetical protein